MMKHTKQTLKTSLLLLLSLLLLWTSCKKKENKDPNGNKSAKELDCDFFKSEGDPIILANDPEAPVDYIVSCDAKVEGDLTIEAGVVIEFKTNAGLQFVHDANYKISMNGTASQPIKLTGLDKVNGYWAGLIIRSNNPSNKMDYVTVEYAGSKSQGWGFKGAIKGATDAVMNFNNCTIKNNKDFGLNWSSGAGALGLKNSKFKGNDIPIITNPNHINSIDGTSTYSGNNNDYIELEHVGVDKDITFHKLDVPFFSHGINPNNDAKRKFVFKPGVTIIMNAGSEIKFDNAFHYEHETIMVGTESEPITIKGKEDVPGYWKGINVWSSNPLNEIAYVNIHNAGETNGYPNGAVKLSNNDSFLKIHDVNFIDCFEYAISLNIWGGSSPIINYNNLHLDNTSKMFSNWEGEEITNP